MHVYMIGPIDDWSGWFEAEEVIRDDAPSDLDTENTWSRPGIGKAEYETELSLAEVLAKRITHFPWEGDVRQGPFIAGFPLAAYDPPFGGNFLIAWKQDNNGATFIASPVEMPHLIDGDNWATL